MLSGGHLRHPPTQPFPINNKLSPGPPLGASSINRLASATDGPENKDIILMMIAMPPPRGSFRLLYRLLCLNLSVPDSASVLHLVPFEISSQPV